MRSTGSGCQSWLIGILWDGRHSKFLMRYCETDSLSYVVTSEDARQKSKTVSISNDTHAAPVCSVKKTFGVSIVDSDFPPIALVMFHGPMIRLFSRYAPILFLHVLHNKPIPIGHPEGSPSSRGHQEPPFCRDKNLEKEERDEYVRAGTIVGQVHKIS